MKSFVIIILLSTNILFSSDFESDTSQRVHVTAGILVDVFDDFIFVKNESTEQIFEIQDDQTFSYLLDKLLYQKIIITGKIRENEDGRNELLANTLYFPEHEILLYSNQTDEDTANDREDYGFPEE